MAINWSTQVYLPCQQIFSVPATFHPVYSQPDAPSYAARGIFGQQDFDVVTEDGGVFSDQRDIFDIRTAEWDQRGIPWPKQKDRVTIPFDSSGAPLGDFEIVDTNVNGGGEMSLVIRKWKQP